VSFLLPDNYRQAIHDRTFEWIRKISHLMCMWSSMAIPAIFNLSEVAVNDWITGAYPPYGGITRSDYPSTMQISEIATFNLKDFQL
jgi:hypothetical protein